jgi:site-specific DNA-adenine methylase
MEILDHIKTDQGYTIRVWLSDIAPDAIDTYEWVKYDPSHGITEKQYQEQQKSQVIALSQQKLDAITPKATVIYENTVAIDEQKALVADEIVTESIDTTNG